jgi:hypothetical protein
MIVRREDGQAHLPSPAQWRRTAHPRHLRGRGQVAPINSQNPTPNNSQNYTLRRTFWCWGTDPVHHSSARSTCEAPRSSCYPWSPKADWKPSHDCTIYIKIRFSIKHFASPAESCIDWRINPGFIMATNQYPQSLIPTFLPTSPRQSAHRAVGPKPIDIIVGGRLRNRREALGLSQGALAAAIRMPSVWIEHYETGQERPRAAHLIEFSRLLGVSLRFFFGSI